MAVPHFNEMVEKAAFKIRLSTTNLQQLAADKKIVNGLILLINSCFSSDGPLRKTSSTSNLRAPKVQITVRFRCKKLLTTNVSATANKMTKENSIAAKVDPVSWTIRLLINGAKVEPKPLINCR